MDNREAAEEQRARVAREQRFNDRLAEAEASIAHLRHCARLQDSATAAVLERAEKAEAELAACREDAERYRWLRENTTYKNFGTLSTPSGLVSPLSRRWYHDSTILTAHTLDDAIDAAKEGA